MEIPTLHLPCLPELANVDESVAREILADKGTNFTLDCVNWPAEYPYKPEVRISSAHTDSAIFINYSVKGNSLRAVNTDFNSHVHQDSCVEFFVAPNDRAPYYNFEFNCIGTPHVAHRLDRHNGTPLPHDTIATIRRYSTCGKKPFEEITGEYSWSLLVVIPLAILGVEYKGEPIRLMGNFYKCADLTAAPHFLSWAPIATAQPDFHRPEFFAPIILD